MSRPRPRCGFMAVACLGFVLLNLGLSVLGASESSGAEAAGMMVEGVINAVVAVACFIPFVGVFFLPRKGNRH